MWHHASITDMSLPGPCQPQPRNSLLSGPQAARQPEGHISGKLAAAARHAPLDLRASGAYGALTSLLGGHFRAGPGRRWDTSGAWCPRSPSSPPRQQALILPAPQPCTCACFRSGTTLR